MKKEPLKGVWIIKVKEEFLRLKSGFDKEDDTLIKLTKEEFKIYLKEEKNGPVDLENLDGVKLGHDKVRRKTHRLK